jgi:hypothetical protein
VFAVVAWLLINPEATRAKFAATDSPDAAVAAPAHS